MTSPPRLVNTTKKKSSAKWLLLAVLLVLAGGYGVWKGTRSDGGGADGDRAADTPRRVTAGGRDGPSMVAETPPIGGGADGPVVAVAVGGGGVGMDGGGRARKVFMSEASRLTTATIERLNLTNEELEAVENFIGGLKEAAIGDFVSRTKIVRKTGDTRIYHHTYYTAARTDKGGLIPEAERRRMTDLLGAERAGEVLGAMEAHETFKLMRGYDVETELKCEGDGAVIEQRYRDPRNGAVVHGEGRMADSFREKFGDLFEIPGEK